MHWQWPKLTHRSLGGRFIFLIALILSVTMSAATYISYQKQYQSYLDSLSEKGNALGKFVALVSPEAILGYDFILLDQYMQEISRREDVVIGAIKSAENNYVTTYINKSHPLLQPIADLKIQDIIQTLQKRDDIIMLKFPIHNMDQYLGTFEIGLSTKRAGELANRESMETLVINSAIILILSLCIYVVFQLKVIVPIHNLIYSSERMAQGELLCHADCKSNDELGQLTRAFNKMSDSLAENYTQLQQSNQELMRATKAKSTFLANMSHEIRTPLTSILGYAELLNDANIDAAERGPAVQTIIRNGMHLQSIINNILDVSKIEADKMELDIESMSPFDLIRDVEALISMQARAKGVDFNVEYHFPLPAMINADSLRLKQVLINLCGNAVKFTSHGTISIGLRCDFEAELLLFDVTDSGIGLDERESRKIFDSFTQADSSTTRKYGGTGLGLPLSRNLCELMGGSITVRSIKGVGSCFTASVATGPLSHQIRLASEIDLQRLNSERSQAQDQSLLQPQSAAQIKGAILVAEDTSDNQRLISLYLRKFDVDVEMVVNGLDAVNAVKNRDYDLILMDMQMPVMGGLEAVTQIREAGITTPIIALTADALVQDKERYFAQGCDGFIAKPINRHDFEHAIMDFLQGCEDPKAANSNHQPCLQESEDAPLLSTLALEDAEFTELVVGYIIDLAKPLASIRQAYREKNWALIRQKVHNLKGSGAAYGFPQLTTLAMQIELHLIDQEYNRIERLLSQMEQLYRRIKAGLDAYVSFSEKQIGAAKQK